MQPLVIYFNEQCLNHTLEDYHWKTGIQKLCDVIDSFFRVRMDANIAFSTGLLQADCGGRPLNIRIQESYSNKDKYRNLLRKTINLANSDVQLLQEIYLDEKSAQGLNSADAIKSWAVSLFLINTVWTQPSITGQRYELDEISGNFNGPTPSIIRHLSEILHMHHWITEIRDWGATVAPSCVLDKLNGHSVVMYQGPKEHNPPHVHLLDKKSGNSLAKYRIDVFERPKGPPTWDAEMKVWVAQYRDQLLKSWARCQQGGLPFEIEK